MCVCVCVCVLLLRRGSQGSEAFDRPEDRIYSSFLGWIAFRNSFPVAAGNITGFLPSNQTKSFGADAKLTLSSFKATTQNANDHPNAPHVLYMYALEILVRVLWLVSARPHERLDGYGHLFAVPPPLLPIFVWPYSTPQSEEVLGRRPGRTRRKREREKGSGLEDLGKMGSYLTPQS